MKNTLPATAFYNRIRDILESARANIARSVNTTQVVTNWFIGREIIEEQQRGKNRADYGKALLKGLSAYLQSEFSGGYSVDNLEWFRTFYITYPSLLEIEKSDAARRKSSRPMPIRDASRGETWQVGWIHANLSWTHYRTLLRVDKAEARAFYEIEAIDNNWSARELERQINSLRRYKLYLPSEEELREEIRREVQRLPPRKPSRPTRRNAKKP